MTKEKRRKEKLSIYLIRGKEKSDDQILKVENAKPPIEIEIQGAEQGLLYIKKSSPKGSPPWTELFTSLPDVPDDAFGFSSSVGAVLLIRLNNHSFILSFGMGFHLIKGEVIERDFGLRVTLNSVDPDDLRSLDKASYDHNPLNSRTQSTRGVDIFELNVDSELDLLYAVTGRSKVKKFGLQITGRDALNMAVQVEIKNIVEILEEAIKRYKRDLPSQFEWIDNINRVRDAEDIELLDLELDSCLVANGYSSFWLGEPEIVDWETQIGYSFDMYANTPRHIVLNLKDYVEYLEERNIDLNVQQLKNDFVHINDNEYSSIKRWSVYRCLYAEIMVGAENYILRNGLWYRINGNFMDSIDLFLAENLSRYDYSFPIYSQEREEDYNAYVSKTDHSCSLMDQKFVKIGGPYDKLEFCDIIKNGTDFIHVKFYRSSSTLSHLFSQGFVAAETFIKDIEFREKLNHKLPDGTRLEDPKKRPDPSNYRVIYAIATQKEIPEELPFFSKVTLKNALKTLQALNFTVGLSKIDVAPELLKTKKCKPRKQKK